MTIFVVSAHRRPSTTLYFVALPTSEQQRILGLIEALSDTTVPVYIVLFRAVWMEAVAVPIGQKRCRKRSAEFS